jgi:hypothetical protein
MLRTVLLLLLWHLLWAPAHGSPALARGSGSALNDADITASKAEFGSLAAQQPPSIGTPASTAAATTSAVPSSLSYAHNLSTARRLLQPPGLPPEARDISLQELLSSIGVSSDGSGGVRVTLPPVPPPNRSSSSNKSADNRPNERGLPAVAVSADSACSYECVAACINDNWRTWSYWQQHLPLQQQPNSSSASFKCRCPACNTALIGTCCVSVFVCGCCQPMKWVC